MEDGGIITVGWDAGSRRVLTDSGQVGTGGRATGGVQVAVRVIHTPTGLTGRVRCAGRSGHTDVETV